MQIIFPNVEGGGEVHLDVLKAICGATSNLSMVDLGCGFASQTRQLGFRSRTYVDVIERDLGEEMPYFLKCGILSNQYFKKYKYDVAFCLDVIEHFPKEVGDYVKYLMGRLASKQVIFTPLGDYLIEKIPTDDPDSHKSGWLPEEFEKDGWATIVFQNFHPTLNIGAFFAFYCDNVGEEFKRVSTELKNKEWSK